KHFLAVIVIFWAIFELPRKPAVRRAWNLGLEGPAGESPRTFTDVRLGVVAGAEAEQLKQFTPPILIDRGPMILLIVQPENHRRISGHSEQQITVVAHALFAEDIDLLQQLVVIVDL